jgi:nicotinic acid mononucleotide adenylyltransferase
MVVCLRNCLTLTSSLLFILLVADTSTSFSYPSASWALPDHPNYMFRVYRSALLHSSCSARSAGFRRKSNSIIRSMASLTSTSTDAAVSDTDNSNRDFSLQRLQDRMEHFVAQHAGECRLVLSIAGGGGHFLSTLASTPGASKALLEGSINYDRESYRRYVEVDLDSETFRYASALSAQYAAEASLRRALQLSAAADPAYGHNALQYMNHSLGLGCASALASSSSRSDATSRAYMCAHKLEGGLLVEMEVRLGKGDNGSNNGSNGNGSTNGSTDTDGSSSTASRRTRFEEDVVVSHCVLDCLEYTVNDNDHDNNGGSGAQQQQRREWEYTTKQGDKIKTVVTKAAAQNRTQVIRQAVNDIVSGTDSAVLLLPTLSRSFQAVSGRTAGLPPHSLVFPGSFHPPHQGHVQLVKESLKASNCQTAWFELSLKNADKPSLEADDVVQRLEQFWNLQDMPENWGIVLTNAPMFKQKVDLLQPLQVSRSFPGGKQHQAALNFVIGTDTLVRLLNPKYYGDNEFEMLRILQEMPCHFVVGGRLAQKTDKTPEFITGQSEVDELPAALQSKFTLMPDFRVDMSSTELRQQQTQTQTSTQTTTTTTTDE